MPHGTRDANRCGCPAPGLQLQAAHRCNAVATEPVKEGHVHIPDGFINASTSLGAGAVAAGGLGVSLRRTAQTLQDRQAPLAGLVAAYIFAVQMLNFPVAAGTSGHLLGGVLAAVLVGPWAGAICVAVVLLVQGLLFADGGLTALGLNITNMALVAGVGGYAVFLLLRRVLPATKAAVAGAAGVAAGISVVMASVAFVVEYAVGGTGGASVGTVVAAMVGVHTLIGVGEGIITALTVGVVLGVRPDLVHGAADLRAPLVLQTAGR
jgi:cobalt/nickel transport system permease protein